MEAKTFTATIEGKLIKIPYFQITGKKAGNSGFISAGVHGDEVNGLSLIHI